MTVTNTVPNLTGYSVVREGGGKTRYNTSYYLIRVCERAGQHEVRTCDPVILILGTGNNCGTHLNLQSWCKDYFKAKIFELQKIHRETSYLTKTGSPENTTAINSPLREFPMNSAVVKTNRPISIKKPN